MAVKGRLEGHSFDLDTLARQLPQGDPHVAVDDEGYYLTSAMLDGLMHDGGKLYEVASSLLRRANGAARALSSGFRPVRLVGRFSDDTGAHHVVVLAETAEARGEAFDVTVVAGGKQQQAPPPPGPKYVQLAQKHKDVAEALDILGKQSPSLDWVDLYKLYEIVRHNVGGEDALIAKDWVPRADIKAFTVSANRPDISGDEARHARIPGPPPKSTRVMTLAEAQHTIPTLVAHWLDSL